MLSATYRSLDPFTPKTTVDLFFYDLREDLDLRLSEPRTIRASNQVVTHPAAMQLACSYLVTARPVGGTDIALQQQRFLARVLRVLSRFPTPVSGEFAQRWESSMPTSISWKLNVDIPSGPSLAIANAVSVDAYDRIAVTVPHSATAAEVEVDVQPGAAGRVRFLLVRSDTYGDNLKFKVHVTGNTAHVLNDVLLLVGAGSLALLESPLDKLLIINTLGHAANLEIIVGRLATA